MNLTKLREEAITCAASDDVVQLYPKIVVALCEAVEALKRILDVPLDQPKSTRRMHDMAETALTKLESL